ncbi:Uncharacterised protein [Mycobacteroides abscessus subsp. abscessus]|nr:Uncharacterised protein [Mycobacteroides abscessus subsp. abscessus]
MAIRTMVYLACDDCLNIEADTTSDSSDEARAIGAAFGWVRRSRRDLCPKCASGGPWYPQLSSSTWRVVRDRAEPHPKTKDLFDVAGYFDDVIAAREEAAERNRTVQASA